MRRLLVAISFFTRIPVKIKWEVSEDEFYSSMNLLPVIGLLIGAILYGIGYLLNGINNEVVSLILIIVYIWLTGGLHIDGFIDTVDGVLSNRDKNRVLEIMKDSRIGAFGAIAIIILLLSYFVLFKYINGVALLIMPIVGRSCALSAASLSKYAKETNDLGKRFVEDMGKKDMVFAIIFTILVIVVADYFHVFPFVFCILLTFYFVHYFKKKISGMTGDTIGMLIELNQVAYLFSLYIIQSFVGGL
ncbi:MAG: adenosylcobinamide-GDP ribazoletransferase [Eubacteriaceae bacterium]